MKRETLPTRPNWTERCKDIGFDFYDLPSSDGTSYWREGVAYCFTAHQIDALEEATNELHHMCLSLVEDIVEGGDYPADYGLSNVAKELIEASWRAKEQGLYGRFDLVYDGRSSIKMLEYNADTPTSLLEAAVAQWHWLKDHNLPDQFNSIHERLIAQWKVIGQSIAIRPRIYFSGAETAGREDWGTIEYLMDTAMQAGVDVSEIPIEQIGWDVEKQFFVDLNDKPITACFKLYPWEWLVDDAFGVNIKISRTRFVEPAWKMLLSTKALLPVLWERHTGHPLLLSAFFDREDERLQRKGEWVRKPILSREGANVSLIQGGELSVISGSDFNPEYDKKGYIIQERTNIPNCDGFYPIVGSWIIGDKAAGIGIREDRNLVTGNNSHFVPHYFTEK